MVNTQDYKEQEIKMIVIYNWSSLTKEQIKTCFYHVLGKHNVKLQNTTLHTLTQTNTRHLDPVYVIKAQTHLSIFLVSKKQFK